jgi:hypothetical protein
MLSCTSLGREGAAISRSFCIPACARMTGNDRYRACRGAQLLCVMNPSPFAKGGFRGIGPGAGGLSLRAILSLLSEKARQPHAARGLQPLRTPICAGPATGYDSITPAEKEGCRPAACAAGKGRVQSPASNNIEAPPSHSSTEPGRSPAKRVVSEPPRIVGIKPPCRVVCSPEQNETMVNVMLAVVHIGYAEEYGDVDSHS